MGFVRQSKYIFPWILRFIFGKKQEYFWIRQKYIETSVSNPPIVYWKKLPLSTKEINKVFQTFLQLISYISMDL